MRSSTLLQASLARFPGGNYPASQHWQNLVYSQREKNIMPQRIKGFDGEGPLLPNSPPPSMSSVMKNNPLYDDLSLEEAKEERKKNPSWTIEEYDKKSTHANLAGHLKENPNDLRFWLGDMYTPGFDTLLKKKKKRAKRSKLCHMGLILLLVSSVLVAIVTLSALFT
ncbi:major intrinsically disordered NOTCH2-binding receptor 1-like isoform X2 [Nannospalax galili]|nr:major intrinsically disordered NOTCH2-binding receptor 1-like isoform X2 [Nannospalax galili]